MPEYAMLTKLTSEGRKTLMNNPGRLWEVNKEVEKMGAKIIFQYALLGDYDFITVLSAASNEVISRVSSNLGSRGTLVPVTYPAIAVPELIKEMSTGKAMR
jgi:uncharacterized protein with GYD domain